MGMGVGMRNEDWGIRARTGEREIGDENRDRDREYRIIKTEKRVKWETDRTRERGREKDEKRDKKEREKRDSAEKREKNENIEKKKKENKNKKLKINKKQ